MTELTVELVEKFRRVDLIDLAEATQEAINDGIGFGWVRPPSNQRLEAYWKGVLVVPERDLFVGRLDDSVAGSIQLLRPPPNFEAGVFSASIDTHFVAPWARGHGLAKMLLEAAEAAALKSGLTVMRLEVRASQERAVALYQSCGYKRWGTLEKYHLVAGKFVAGYFYAKDLA
ncbi:MAG: GNAT family N-acetyltransferase [Pseudomonadota bacterium]|nr:GNAT family N-acetyltransferase [Pseudomonadota bacterium]